MSIDEQIIKRNEKWIACSKRQIREYQQLIEQEIKCIEDLVSQNRELKGRE